MATIPNPTNRIITKGLGGPACQGIITMHFSVFKIEIIPAAVGGGPYPANSGAWNQATPQANPAFFYVPAGQNWDPEKFVVKITANLGKKDISRHFIVGKKRKNAIVKINNLFLKTKTKLTETVEKIIIVFKRDNK